jgi:protoporphyrinogen oxidase
MKSNIIILGSGISGISCAYHLKKKGLKSIIYDKDNDWGGLCGNFSINGFRFDRFVHFTFTNNQYIKNIFESSSECYTHKPESTNYSNGLWLRHPVQNNLYPLPLEDKIKIIKGFINRADIKVKTYKDWLISQYGAYFSKKFPMKYTKKYWTVEADKLGTKWISNKMNKLNLEDVLTGAMKEHENNDYYTTEMRYPKFGGFKSIMNNMRIDLNIELNKEVIEIDIKDRCIYFKEGKTVSYDTLVSSIPITEMVKLVKDTPVGIINEAKKLLCTSGYLVSLGFNRIDIPKSLWFYIYDEDILPSRVYSPSLKSPDNAPNNCSSLQAEIYFSREFVINMKEDDLLNHVIDKLKDMKLFKDDDLILKDIRKEKFANVVFTKDIYKSRDIVKEFLTQNNIELIGRFGEWEYFWSDQSFMSGKRASDRITEKKY